MTDAELVVGGERYRIHDIRALARTAQIDLDAVPFVGRVLIEFLLRSEPEPIAYECARRLAAGQPADVEIAFLPTRLLMQDFTAVPALVDCAALRDRVAELGGSPAMINPVVPTQIVVDHSLQVESAGTPDALAVNVAIEMRRNDERYRFLRWAEHAFDNLTVVPPGNGIVHQVNLERLTTIVASSDREGVRTLTPDTVIGTDSHTTMVNGLGVLGWGVGGIEAEAILLGQPVRTHVPALVGVQLEGRTRPGVTAMDVALSLTEFFRQQGVVGAWLELMGPGAARMSATDRCTIANMAPEYGAMCAFFPVDAQTLRYMRTTGRSTRCLERVEAYCNRQGLFRHEGSPSPRFARVLTYDLGQVEASVAGPRNPHERVPLPRLRDSFEALQTERARASSTSPVADGAIVLAAITSCTNTSNPAAMIAAGLVAKRAVERGLVVPPHVKTSFAPGSRSVTTYLEAAGLLGSLEALGFHIVGYACATCNGGGGPLEPGVEDALDASALVASVSSGNRNFEGRIHPRVRANYLASPPLVVALALAGSVTFDPSRDPIGIDRNGKPVLLAELLPDDAEINALVERVVTPHAFAFEAPARSPAWQALDVVPTAQYPWSAGSTYIRRPPFCDAAASDSRSIDGARVLLALGDNVSTDHISPVGAIAPSSPAGRYLADRGVAVKELNSYGSRRGNHEVMARGTFAHAHGTTVHVPSGQRIPVFEAAERYRADGTPLVVLAGRNYGIGSSRDWAAKGPWFLGVRAVLAESFERIHRTNLVAMGILPVQLPRPWRALGLTGGEELSLRWSDAELGPRFTVRVRASSVDGGEIVFESVAQIDSSAEIEIFQRGGLHAHLLDQFSKRHAHATS